MHKTIIISFLLVCTACQKNPGNNSIQEENAHQHAEESSLYTLFSDQYEFYIEHAPLRVGEETEFLVHLTDLETYKPPSSGKVTVQLDGISFTAESPSEPGIFHVPVIPQKEGEFHSEITYASESRSQRVEAHINVHSDHETHPLNEAGEVEEEHDHEMETSGEITFLKEQAWKANFMVKEVLPGPFHAVISTSGEMMAVPGEKKNITASSQGIVRFEDPLMVQGSIVKKGQLLFTLSSESLVEDNIRLRFEEAKNRLVKSRSEYQRHKVLYEQEAVSQRLYMASLSSYAEDSLRYYSLARNITEDGVQIKAPVSGTIHELIASDGEYTEPGQLLATLSTNRTLLLRADLPQQYFRHLGHIYNAHFRPAYTDRVFSVEEMNGTLLAAGVSVAENDHYLPVIFKLENDGQLLEGAFAEVYLQAEEKNNILILPLEAIGEEQGGHYVYVQVSGESYSKRPITIGENDGRNVEVKQGLVAGERVVTQGRMLVKAASMATGIVGHTHAH